MKRSSILLAAIWSGLVFGQAPPRNRVIGVVTETASGSVKVKTDAGEVFSVVFAPETRFQKIAPGERDLTKAQTIEAKEIAVGDRVLARGPVSEQTVAAAAVIVMSRDDLAQKQERERSEWVRHGVAGLVVSTDAAAKEIKIRIPSLMGEARVVAVALSEHTKFRRYAPDSVRFADALPSTLAEVKPGDQLRARGDKAEDGTRIAAEEVVTGSFQTVAATVVAVRANEVQVKDLQSGKALTVTITPQATLRRLPAFGGGMGPGGPGGGVPPGNGPSQSMRPAGMGGRMPDFQQMMERMPATTVAELKTGETILVSSTRGASAEHLTAITVLAGADTLLAMAQARAQRQGGQAGGAAMGSWNLNDISMMPMQ